MHEPHKLSTCSRNFFGPSVEIPSSLFKGSFVQNKTNPNSLGQEVKKWHQNHSAWTQLQFLDFLILRFQSTLVELPVLPLCISNIACVKNHSKTETFFRFILSSLEDGYIVF